MQNDTTNTTRQKTKSSNGRWVQRQEAEMDNEASTPSTFAPQTTSTPSVSERHASSAGDSAMTFDSVISGARHAYDSVVSRGSDLMSKVDLSRGTNAIKEYPIQAAVGGLIIGFLLGAAVCRRQS